MKLDVSTPEKCKATGPILDRFPNIFSGEIAMKHIFWILLVVSLAGCYVPSIPIRHLSALPVPSNPDLFGVPENEPIFGVWDFIR
jgi:hypothetical protein